MPAADVDGDDDPRAEGGDDVVEEVDVAERGGADDRALGAGAQRVADGVDACAGRRRTGPGRRSRATIRRRCSSERGSPERAPSRSTTCRKRAPASTHDGRPRAGRRGRSVASSKRPSTQAHRLAVHDVDRRVEDHATRPPRAREVAQQRSPSREDFSGWNCAAIDVAALDDRDEALAVLARGRRRRRVGRPAGERVHVVEGRGLAEALGQRRRRARRSRGSSRCAAAAAPRSARHRRRAGARARRRPRARSEALEQQLHAEADAEQRHAGRGALAQHLAEAGRARGCASPPGTRRRRAGRRASAARITSWSAVITRLARRRARAPSRRCAGCPSRSRRSRSRQRPLGRRARRSRRGRSRPRRAARGRTP